MLPIYIYFTACHILGYCSLIPLASPFELIVGFHMWAPLKVKHVQLFSRGPKFCLDIWIYNKKHPYF